MMMRLPAVVGFIAAGMVAAQSVERPVLEVPYADTSPVLNAATDDQAWQTATVIDHLSPAVGAAEGQPMAATRIQVLWTKAALVVRFQCAAQTVIRAPEANAQCPVRDLPYFHGDCVEVFLDVVGDGREFIEIQISPDNGVFDGRHLYTAPIQSDDHLVIQSDLIKRQGWFFPEWNMPGLRTAASLHLDGSPPGWTAVLEIPAASVLKRLGKKEFTAGMELRANFLRLDFSSIPRSGAGPAITNWAPVVYGRAHRSPAGMGYLRLQPNEPATSQN